MKRLRDTYRLFMIGFLAAFVLFNLTMCPESSSPTQPPINETGKETKQLQDFNTKVENTFSGGNTDEVIKITYDDFAGVMKEQLTANPGKVAKFAEAFKNRKLLYANDLYAEYEITDDSGTYTVAMGQSGDGVWKLIRF